MVVFLFWKIWKARNALLFQQHNQDYSRIISTALTALNDFKDATVRANSFSHPQPSVMLSQSPPPAHCPKASFDFALDKINHLCFAAIVLHDHGGIIINWRFQVYPNIDDPFIAEGLACRDAILLLLHRGIQQVIIEGGWKNLILALQNKAFLVDILNIGEAFDSSIQFVNFFLLNANVIGLLICWH